MDDFEQRALDLFQTQVRHVAIYKAYAVARKIVPSAVKRLHQIPFLPIAFFKTHTVLAKGLIPEAVFESSATTSQVRSKHHIVSLTDYHHNTQTLFEQRYGPLSDYNFYFLLPGYEGRQTASLLSMCSYFLEQSGNKGGFYGTDVTALEQGLQKADGYKKPFVWGVTHALLRWATHAVHLPKGAVLMETGGMKGHGKELIREELHAILCNAFGVEEVQSEYGMTELLSQCYTNSTGLFQCNTQMHVLVREVNDAFSYVRQGATGALNVIDLANTHSCAFIETQDLGRLHEGGQFEVLGRMDIAETRGCNVLYG